MDKTLTDNEIIKALECCASETTEITCGDCPLCETGKPDCHFVNAQNALDLINRQKEENINLKGHLKQLKSRHDIAKSEIERLQSMNQAKLDMIHDLQAEKSNLEIELAAMRGAANSYKAEIERLKKVCDLSNRACRELRKRIEPIKAEAIKKFAERLKRELPKWLHPYIDRTKKEMAGDE